MDYNIYIHTDGANGGSNPTVPWSSDGEDRGSSFQSNTEPWSKVGNGIVKATGIAQNPDGLVAAAFSKAAKAIPAIAIAYAVIKLTDKVVSEVIDFKVIESGDYTAQRKYNNFKTAVQNVTHPLSTLVNYEKLKRADRIATEASKENLLLFGDTYINGFNGYGV